MQPQLAIVIHPEDYGMDIVHKAISDHNVMALHILTYREWLRKARIDSCDLLCITSENKAVYASTAEKKTQIREYLIFVHTSCIA